MRIKINVFWTALLTVTGIFCLIYLWYTFFPGETEPRLLEYFSPEQVMRGREYQRPLQLASIISIIGQIILLSWFVFSGKARCLSERLQQKSGSPYWPGLGLFVFLFWLMVSLITLPYSLFAGFYWQKRWGFSTQSMGAWWLDYFKGAGLELLFLIVAVMILFLLIRKWPRGWWLVVSGLFCLWLVVQIFLWPVLISPLYNEFVPAQDPAVLEMVRELSEKANVPVEQVLIMDASKRTTKANAYFSGMGRTKRIVLYDNLLRDYSTEEVRSVIAHEMAHWQQGHIIQGLTWGFAGSILVWALLYLLVALTVPRQERDKPYVLAVITLGILLLTFLAGPLENNISRRMEKEADRIAVFLTADPEAAIRLQANLALKNLSELSPAGFIEWFSYSHPSVLSRIEIIEQGQY